MFHLKHISRAVLVLCAGGVAVSAVAQQSQSTQLERVEVTGSSIKRINAETASPVQILTREDIEKSGKQSVQEVLRGVTADGQGSIPASFTNGFASGSAAVSLRGLGVNSTLVLVNGRRMTTYGLADDGSRNFVDLNSLPLEAVDRIEVVKDGASAIYGADAVGGVVNVILRKNYTGKSVGGSFGATGDGDGQTTRAFGSFGFGDVSTDKYNVFFTFEAARQKPIWAKDRGFIGQSDLTSYGFFDTTNGQSRPWIDAGPTANSPYGVIRNPDTNARVNLLACDASAKLANGLCGYNTLVDSQVQPQTDRLNVFGRGTFEFSDALTGYAELGVFTTKSKSHGTLGANNDGGVYRPGDPFDPLIVHGLMTLPAGHPDNPYGVDRTLGIRPTELGGGRNQVTDNSVVRVVAGLQGTAYGWDFDTAVGYIHSRLKNTQTGYIVYDAMQAALDNGTYRISNTAKTSPSVLAAISPTLEITPTSSVKFIDFKASRELMALPGGSLGLAVGGETRWEKADTPPVPGTDTGSIVGLGYSSFKADRRVSALYGELNAPVTKQLELNGALRYDHYSDFGSSTTPKLGFKFKPIDQFALRGTYSEAFRAPGPAETGGSSFGFTTVGILSQGNPDIKPEKAKSYTLGLIAEPVPGTSASIDLWNIKRKDEIVQADPAAIIPAGTPQTADPFTKIAGAQPNTFIYYDSTGQLATVTGFYYNATSTRTNGVDLELRHKMKLGAAGNLSAQFTLTHVNKFERTLPDGTVREYAGTHGPISLSSGSGTPKDRGSFSLTWDRNPFSVTATVNYVGGLKLIDHKGEQAVDNGDGTVTDTTNGLIYTKGSTLDCSVFNTDGSASNGCRLPSYTTVDLFMKWSPFKNLDLNFSVQNLFARKAPLDQYLVLTYGSNYNQAWHQSGAVGRLFTVGARYSF